MMDVPSIPIHLVMTTSWPGLAPDVVMILSAFAFPTPVTLISGWFTARVTSVCPPIT